MSELALIYTSKHGRKGGILAILVVYPIWVRAFCGTQTCFQCCIMTSAISQRRREFGEPRLFTLNEQIALNRSQNIEAAYVLGDERV